MAHDHRDAGESSRLPETSAHNPFVALAGGGRPVYSSEDMTDDAAAVLDALGWDSAGGLPSGVWPRVARGVRTVADRAEPRVEGRNW